MTSVVADLNLRCSLKRKKRDEMLFLFRSQPILTNGANYLQPFDNLYIIWQNVAEGENL